MMQLGLFDALHSPPVILAVQPLAVAEITSRLANERAPEARLILAWLASL